MSDEKMRAEFEAWAVPEGYAMDCMISGHYMHASTSAAWHAWQASRAALVVELPFEFVNGMMRADQVIAAIDAAGVRVKP